MCKKDRNGERPLRLSFWTILPIVFNLIFVGYLIYECIYIPNVVNAKRTTSSPPPENTLSLIGCYIIIAATILDIFNGLFLEYALVKNKPGLLLIWIIIQIIIGVMTLVGIIMYIFLSVYGVRVYFMFIMVLGEIMEAYNIWNIWEYRRKLIRTLAMIDMIYREDDDDDENEPSDEVNIDEGRHGEHIISDSTEPKPKEEA